jgi:hypothetical protein
MYILAAMLLGGLICNLLIRPVADHFYMTDAQLAEERKRAHEVAVSTAPAANGQDFSGRARGLVTVAWIAVGIPLAWGIWITLTKAAKLFS